ncbi:MAG: hypothetical protein WD066_13075 [Planctomycetaceae bacterium]
MPDDSARLRSIDYRAVFPWTHLFRGFRIAVDFRKVLVGALGLLVLLLGDLAISRLPFSPPAAARGMGAGVTTDLAEARSTLVEATRPLAGRPDGVGSWLSDQFVAVIRPWTDFVDRGGAIFRRETTADWSGTAHAWTRLLWLLIVTALFGGALARMAAVQFARDEKLGLWPALRFAVARFPSFLTAPLLPVLGIGVLWGIVALLGLLGRIPVAGPPVVGALWLIPLVLAFVMTLILLGVAAGWPLMYATIGTEDSDAFDGFSRSYSYVFGRPWQYLWTALVAMIYGGLLVLFVAGVALLVLHLSAAAAATGFGAANTEALLSGMRPLFGLDVDPADSPAGPLRIGAALAGGWLSVIGLLVSGFAYSYFWTAATIIYFLLRHSDDGTDLDEVQLTGDADEDDLLPLVGVAASDQPVVERLPPIGATPTSADPSTAPPSSPAASGSPPTDPIPTGDTEFDIRDAPED